MKLSKVNPAAIVPFFSFFLSTYAIPSRFSDARVRDGINKTITLCTALNFDGTCVDVPASDCVNLVGGLTGLNKEVSSAVVPERTNCTLFSNFGCLQMNPPDDDHDKISLPTGSYPNFFEITVQEAEPRDFNDMTSSFVCVDTS
ncbi:hypothetical protein K435DRAFT_971420 [Dendrothele bispora CBS 962.96]|uniref:Uncharacterized protein n=1 Tax=Dendrothele bispora (strain CBS 962.96) TaxID=1314807 RepID=A0A4S8L5F8_DENBC|nr:hypothetical protein K435DRAFT_971420 [Dendrothele bispora CBS 962.96]